MNEGHDLLHEEFCVTIGAAAAEARRFGRCVLMDASFAYVVNSDDDDRLHDAGENKIVGGVAHVPVHAGNKGSGAVEKILPVVHIEDWEAPVRLVVISGREIDNEVALIAKKARAKLFMFVELGGAHGTIITKRS